MDQCVEQLSLASFFFPPAKLKEVEKILDVNAEELINLFDREKHN
ncbi:MAG: hypothetical protein AB2L14_01830 [Candidatus Xenobiia bacterium LiM19]